VDTADGKSTLGYFVIGQVCFFYVLLVILKFCILPVYEKKYAEANSEGFILYEHIYTNAKQLRNLTIPQLQLIHRICINRMDEFSLCFPRTAPIIVKS